MQVLVCLAENAGQMVAKERLMQTVWPDTFVTDDVLTRAISELRRVLGDAAREPHVIQTIPKSGYRLMIPVSFNGPPSEGAVHGLTAPESVSASLTDGGRATARDEARRRSRTRGAWAIGFVAVVVAPLLVWRWVDSGTPVSRVTIAVLPFEHLGGDPERQYLTDGLTEETTASLGQIDPEHVSVIGRTSTRAYKGTRKTVAEIGRELGAEYLVEGSVRAEGRRLRVTSKLIRVRDQVQTWAASYDSEPQSMLEVQQELSTTIARQIGLRLTPARLTALSRRHSTHAEAYDLYLRGRHFWNQFTPQTNQRAVEQYVRATQLDPEYALAWSGLADAYTASPINGDAPPLQIAPRARNAAARAVEHGRDLAETQASLGWVHYFLDWDWPAAEASFRTATTLDPSYSAAPRTLGVVLGSLGRHEEARAAVRRARELEPLAPMEHALSSHVAFAARDFKSALQFARQATILGPQAWVGQFHLAQAYEQLSDRESVQQALTITERFGDANSKMVALRGYILARLGRTNEARDVLSTLEALARERYVPAYSMALVHAGLGDRDAALQWLERAYEARDVHLVFLAFDPKWDPFRGDPRFRALIGRCDFWRTARTGL
jgi:TolB-like protein/tetratricopeptide (TPR) repeat protein